MTDELTGKRILVTGGAGAIGSNLVGELSKQDCRIVILDDLSSGFNDMIPVEDNVKFIKGSILDTDLLDRIFSDHVDFVFHLAALFANQNSVDNPEKDLDVNARGTLLLLEYAKKHDVDRFIYASSSCVYGNMAGEGDEDSSRMSPDTPYAISKLAGEHYTNFFHEFHDVKTVIFRIFNSFGPGEKPGKYRNVIPNMFWRAMDGKPLVVYGTGEETRDFNWTGNLVQAFIKASQVRDAVGETFNIGSGSETKIIDLANTIATIVGGDVKIEFQPRRKWDKVIRRCANVQKAERLLGYEPDNTNFEEKMRETYLWIKENVKNEEVK
ncbi:NAD-dependent epimerase/dehydratase family protein [Candidatus Woesearchaeota archaeon]|nr:NAD-dependent epimerase/dehydratase family protein [Candidatus Woesearchaeota archaeon]